MGFFDSFVEGFNSAKKTRENREIIEMYHDLHDYDTDYRKKAFDNTDSNNGWICFSNTRGSRIVY